MLLTVSHLASDDIPAWVISKICPFFFSFFKPLLLQTVYLSFRIVYEREKKTESAPVKKQCKNDTKNNTKIYFTFVFFYVSNDFSFIIVLNRFNTRTGE